MVLYVINSVITKLAIILMNKATVISCIKTQGKFRGTQGKHREFDLGKNVATLQNYNGNNIFY